MFTECDMIGMNSQPLSVLFIECPVITELFRKDVYDFTACKR